MKKEEAAKPTPKSDRVANAVVVVVCVCVAMTFALLYTLTPPTVAMVEHQYAENQK